MAESAARAVAMRKACPTELSVEQTPGFDAKWHCQFLDHRDSRIAATAFNVRDIRSMNTGAVGEIFLAPALLLAKAANVDAKARAYIHAFH